VDALAFCGVLTLIFLVYQNDSPGKPSAARARLCATVAGPPIPGMLHREWQLGIGRSQRTSIGADSIYEVPRASLAGICEAKITVYRNYAGPLRVSGRGNGQFVDGIHRSIERSAASISLFGTKFLVC
jgi:hypothetical protein